MQYPSTTKTEHRALNALEVIIDEHSTMEHQFSGNDKEMSWDGYIWLYKENNGVQSGKNFDARVPVQIKGHYDRNHKYLCQDTISYPVRLIDLEAYSTERGVLYFEIFLDGICSSIFYASLYPSRIADYLEDAKRKGNKSKYNIPFHRLNKDADRLYIIAKQFDNEARQQGSAYTQIVQDRIKGDDFSKLKSINLKVIGAKDSYSALRRLSSGDICLYGKTDGDKYYRPLEWIDNLKVSIGRDINREISVGNEVFYRQYRCVADSDGGMVIVPSPNLELRLTEGKLKFTPVSTLDELYRDARFVQSLNAHSAYSIANQQILYRSSRMSHDFKNRLDYIIDLYEILKMIGFAVNVEFSYYSEDQQRQLIKLINLRKYYSNAKLKDTYTKYLWQFDGKYAPLIISKEGDKVEFINSVYTDKLAVFLPSDEGEGGKEYRMPLFSYQNADVLSHLYYYDYEAFQRQIDNSDINEATANAILDCVLLMINVFDINGDQHFLELSESLLRQLQPYIENEILLLNNIQIRKRLKVFDDDDVVQLRGIDSENIQVLFGKSVLLGDVNAAKEYFDRFPADEQIRYKKFPIYKLYSDLL